VQSAKLSRTVISTVPLYLVRSSVEGRGRRRRSSGLGIEEVERDKWLQLMCCTLSELPSSQFTRVEEYLIADERD